MTPKISCLTKAKPKEVIGSSFAGYLHIAYRDLVQKLGEPNDRTAEGKWESSDQKVRAEWAFKFGTKKRSAIITIYDYKENLPIEEIILWHVGSKGNKTVVHGFLSRFLSATMEASHEKHKTGHLSKVGHASDHP